MREHKTIHSLKGIKIKQCLKGITYKFHVCLVNQIPGLSSNVLLHLCCKGCKSIREKLKHHLTQETWDIKYRLELKSASGMIMEEVYQLQAVKHWHKHKHDTDT